MLGRHRDGGKALRPNVENERQHWNERLARLGMAMCCLSLFEARMSSRRLMCCGYALLSHTLGVSSNELKRVGSKTTDSNDERCKQQRDEV